MIDYFQVQKLSIQNNVSPVIIEKDYFIELILYFFSKDDYLNKNIIFRGGTAIKKIYFPAYRFSEDLDFVINTNDDINIYNDSISRIFKKISLEYPITIDKRNIFKSDQLQIFASFDIISNISGIKELKLDILKDTYIPKNEEKILQLSYPEFRDNRLTLKAYLIESIVCDKIGRITDIDNVNQGIYMIYGIYYNKTSILT